MYYLFIGDSNSHFRSSVVFRTGSSCLEHLGRSLVRKRTRIKDDGIFTTRDGLDLGGLFVRRGAVVDGCLGAEIKNNLLVLVCRFRFCTWSTYGFVGWRARRGDFVAA